MNKAGMDMLIKVFFMDVYLKVGWINLRINIFLLETAIQFYKVVHHFIFPPVIDERSSRSTYRNHV